MCRLGRPLAPAPSGLGDAEESAASPGRKPFARPPLAAAARSPALGASGACRDAAASSAMALEQVASDAVSVSQDTVLDCGVRGPQGARSPECAPSLPASLLVAVLQKTPTSEAIRGEPTGDGLMGTTFARQRPSCGSSFDFHFADVTDPRLILSKTEDTTLCLLGLCFLLACAFPVAAAATSSLLEKKFGTLLVPVPDWVNDWVPVTFKDWLDPSRDTVRLMGPMFRYAALALGSVTASRPLLIRLALNITRLSPTASADRWFLVELTLDDVLREST